MTFLPGYTLCHSNQSISLDHLFEKKYLGRYHSIPLTNIEKGGTDFTNSLQFTILSFLLFTAWTSLIFKRSQII